MFSLQKIPQRNTLKDLRWLVMILLAPPSKIGETEHSGDIIRSPNVWFAKILTDDCIKIGETICVIIRGLLCQ